MVLDDVMAEYRARAVGEHIHAIAVHIVEYIVRNDIVVTTLRASVTQIVRIAGQLDRITPRNGSGDRLVRVQYSPRIAPGKIVAANMRPPACRGQNHIARAPQLGLADRYVEAGNFQTTFLMAVAPEFGKQDLNVVGLDQHRSPVVRSQRIIQYR